MYYEFFGLKQPPFKITPNTEFFFEGGNRGPILDALIYAVMQGEGMIKVTGEVGSGKTMLCRTLQTRLPAHIETIYLANPSVSPDEILHAIAFELHLDIPQQASRYEVMQRLHDYLLARHTESRQVVMFVEEAQSMPITTLEEIRLLSNLETEQHKLLQIVLFGQPELDRNLSQPEIRQFRERITHSFSLGPLSANEVRDYLNFRLHAAGYRGPALFNNAISKYITKLSGGLTRRVNLLADKALLAAFADNTHLIKRKHVKAALSDSEFNNNLIGKPNRLARGIAYAIITCIVIGAAYFLYQMRNSQTLKPAVSQSDAAVSAQKPASTNNANIVTSRLQATQAWLAQADENSFTIEIARVGEEGQLVPLVQTLGRHLETDAIFIYRTSNDQQPIFVVVYDHFADRDAAAATINTLPEELKSYPISLRTIRGVRKDIDAP